MKRCDVILKTEVSAQSHQTLFPTRGGVCMAVASGLAGPVLVGPLFHSNKFLLGFHQCFTAWQRKSSNASASPRDSKLDIQGLETRPTHGMETGSTRAALLTSRVELSGMEMALTYYTELKNRMVRSGSVVQSTKVLREPIQVAKVKKFSALCANFITTTQLYALPSAVAVPLKNSLLRAWSGNKTTIFPDLVFGCLH